jgi:hypothetical protein
MLTLGIHDLIAHMKLDRQGIPTIISRDITRLPRRSLTNTLVDYPRAAHRGHQYIESLCRAPTEVAQELDFTRHGLRPRLGHFDGDRFTLQRRVSVSLIAAKKDAY